MTTWSVKPKWKKSVIERQILFKDDDQIIIETGWRWGTFYCDTEDDNPPNIVEGDDLYDCGYDVELEGTWDGCWADYRFSDNITEEERNRLLSQSLKEITHLTVNLIAKGISAVKIPNAVVDDSEQIKEFLLNCDNTLFKQIRDRVINMKGSSEIKPLSVKCTECGTEYLQPFTLDMTSFFDRAS